MWQGEEWAPTVCPRLKVPDPGGGEGVSELGKCRCVIVGPKGNGGTSCPACILVTTLWEGGCVVVDTLCGRVVPPGIPWGPVMWAGGGESRWGCVWEPRVYGSNCMVCSVSPVCGRGSTWVQSSPGTRTGRQMGGGVGWQAWGGVAQVCGGARGNNTCGSGTGPGGARGRLWWQSRVSGNPGAEIPW